VDLFLDNCPDMIGKIRTSVLLEDQILAPALIRSGARRAVSAPSGSDLAQRLESLRDATVVGNRSHLQRFGEEFPIDALLRIQRGLIPCVS